jgi:hypothetical protein
MPKEISMEDTKRFCEILRKRSCEHAEAMKRVNDLPGMMVSILRQELDSMIRAVYLLSISDFDERKRLIKQTLDGCKWTELTKNGKAKPITDRDMVELSNKLQGWTLSVYKFGCSFIHFSSFHGYTLVNPFTQIDSDEQKNILDHLRHYHGGPMSDTPSFEELARYFPRVFDKIAGNLECYIKDLENDEVIRKA